MLLVLLRLLVVLLLRRPTASVYHARRMLAVSSQRGV
jgi:hypothetical protein